MVGKDLSEGSLKPIVLLLFHLKLTGGRFIFKINTASVPGISIFFSDTSDPQSFAQRRLNVITPSTHPRLHPRCVQLCIRSDHSTPDVPLCSRSDSFYYSLKVCWHTELMLFCSVSGLSGWTGAQKVICESYLRLQHQEGLEKISCENSFLYKKAQWMFVGKSHQIPSWNHPSLLNPRLNH